MPPSFLERGGGIHVVKFRRTAPGKSVSRPQSSQATRTTPQTDTYSTDVLIPAACRIPDLMQGGVLDILQVFRALIVINSMPEDFGLSPDSVVSPASFFNHRIASKLIHEAASFHSIAKAAQPSWCRAIMQACPFMIPYKHRHRFFRANAFGAARALQFFRSEMQGEASDGDLGNERAFSRTKVVVRRSEPLNMLGRALYGFGRKHTVLEFTFDGEAGSGLGPTLEYYCLLSHALQETSLGLWRDEAVDKGTHVVTTLGLFPQPKAECDEKTSSIFLLLGMLLARTLQDQRSLDLHLNPLLLKWILGHPSCQLADIKLIDSGLHKTLSKLQQIIFERDAIRADSSLSDDDKNVRIAGLTFDGSSLDDIQLDYVLPGYDDIKLGSHEFVTMNNVHEYVDVSHF